MGSGAEKDLALVDDMVGVNGKKKRRQLCQEVTEQGLMEKVQEQVVD